MCKKPNLENVPCAKSLSLRIRDSWIADLKESSISYVQREEKLNIQEKTEEQKHYALQLMASRMYYKLLSDGYHKENFLSEETIKDLCLTFVKVFLKTLEIAETTLFVEQEIVSLLNENSF
jgi:hypothetical protein